MVLDAAAKKFQEAAALALFNWGNVHMCAARKAMDGGRDPPLSTRATPGAMTKPSIYYFRGFTGDDQT